MEKIIEAGDLVIINKEKVSETDLEWDNAVRRLIGKVCIVKNDNYPGEFTYDITHVTKEKHHYQFHKEELILVKKGK